MGMNAFIAGLIAGIDFKISEQQKRKDAVLSRPPSKIRLSVVEAAEKNIQAFRDEIVALTAQIDNTTKTNILGVEYEVLSLTKFPSLQKIQGILFDHRFYEIELPRLPDVTRERGNKAKCYDTYLIDWAEKNPNPIVLPHAFGYHSADYNSILPF